VAEVASRFTDVDAFLAAVKEVGFKLVEKVSHAFGGGGGGRRGIAEPSTSQQQDASTSTHFLRFEFTKTAGRSVASLEKLEAKAGKLLRPCVYKKR
jgi:alanyl-tRNA synthetase